MSRLHRWHRALESTAIERAYVPVVNWRKRIPYEAIRAEAMANQSCEPRGAKGPAAQAFGRSAEARVPTLPLVPRAISRGRLQ